ncbi:MAG: S8 family serine peptidase, partial [Verrucomicrobia bacterium]|nr:S8 family serine peptidase [Verrucomicrobiota bacterium]
MPPPCPCARHGFALRRFTAVLLAVMLLAPLARLRAADAEISPEEVRLGHRARTLLAKPRAGTALPADTATTSETSAHLRLVRSHPRLGGLRTLESDGSEDILETVKRLAATGLYDYVEPDYLRTTTVVPNDPSFDASQWSLNNTGQDGGTAGADIRAPAAWEILHDAPDVIVAVIDTGLFYTHEDIVGNVLVNTAEFSGRAGVDDDNNGYLDDILGINTTAAKTSIAGGDPFDVDGHGSHVAGIIGATGNNGKGITGVAWKTKILPLKFISKTTGSVSGSVACIDYAISRGANVINGSYGSTTFSQAEFDALKRARDAGIIFVAAAGNDGQEISSQPEYPAAYPRSNIVAVAATNRQDKIASYSTYGSGLVELAAPGSSIYSLGISSNTAYVALSGTSMAAPHVTGALALLKQKFPTDNYRALINRLLSSVDELPALNHTVHTNGRLNLARALASTSNRPFNDDFARRATITGTTNNVRGSNQFATLEAGEPDHGVPGTTGSLWWTWTAPAGAGKLLLTTAGSGLDTVLAVYTGDTLATLKRVAFNDDAAAGSTASSLTFDVTPGTAYTIAVAGKNGAEGLVTFRLGVLAANDAFANAQVLTGSAAVAEGNNANATRETGDPTLSRAAKGLTLWYKWVAPATRRYQVSAYGTSTDPIVGVYTGSGLGALTQVALDDDSGPGLDSLVTLSATAGVTYDICVDTASGAGGNFTLSIADSEWQYVTEYSLFSAPAVGPDGTVYFGDENGYIHAVNASGTRKWRYTATSGYMESGAIAVAPDGTLYCGDDTGLLYALTPGATGATLKWKYQAGDYIWTAPALAADGTIYVKTDDGQLSAVNPDGTLRWKFAVHGDTYSSPVVAADGTIYISSDDNGLYAVNPDGTKKWRAELGASCYASPALGADGTIYLGNYDGRFFALRADGTERWHFDTGSPLSSSAALDARGFVYFGSYDNKLYALNATTGAKQWEFATGDTIRGTCPLVADDGAIYVGSANGLVYALEPDGKLRRTFATSGLIYAAPVLAAGRLYVPSGDAKLYAFQIGANLARSPWPMHRQNLRRLGRSEDLAGFPTIATQPTAPASVTAGTPVSLSVAATANGGLLTYQWLFNNVAVAGATSSTLALASAQTSDAGTYQAVVTGPGGSIVSTRVTLSITSTVSNAARLTNLAVRTTAGAGDKLLTVGLAVGGFGTTGNKPFLLRAVGPTLGAFGVPGVLADPKLTLFSGTTQLDTNDNWSGDAAVAAIAPQLGAFALAGPTSKDAALLTSRPAGSYTVQITAATGDAGIALAEIYDATPATSFTATTPRLINVSARMNVTTGEGTLIAGLVIAGNAPKTVLIRGIGPTLSVFGVAGVLADP